MNDNPAVTIQELEWATEQAALAVDRVCGMATRYGDWNFAGWASEAGEYLNHILEAIHNDAKSA